MLHEEECGEVCHALAFCGATGFASEAREVVSDVRVEAFEFLGQHLSDEMRAFGKNGGVSSEIVGKNDLSFRLGKGGEKIPQVFGSPSAHMNAEDASVEITQRYPEP